MPSVSCGAMGPRDAHVIPSKVLSEGACSLLLGIASPSSSSRPEFLGTPGEGLGKARMGLWA